jgi:CHAD domain-containing protein
MCYGEADGTMAHATTHGVTALFRSARRNAAKIRAGVDKAARADRRAVHQVRVASRRLRAILPILASLDGDRWLEQARAVRRASRALADLRDIDVATGVLETLGADAGWNRLAMHAVEAHCAAVRDDRLKKAGRRLKRIRRQSLAPDLEMARRAIEGSPPSAVTVAVAGEVRRRLTAFQVALDKAGVI